MKKEVLCGTLLLLSSLNVSSCGEPEDERMMTLKFILPIDSFRQEEFDQDLVREKMPAELAFDDVPYNQRANSQYLASMVLGWLLGRNDEMFLDDSELKTVFLFNQGSNSPIRVIFRSRAVINKIYKAWEEDRQAALLVDKVELMEVHRE